MPIRDADMYSQGIVDCTGTTTQLALPCQWIRVAGNRGASGIDGLLSTATGFAVGCKKRVLCVVGDVSFLHDTNGLATLSSRMLRKPITMIVINNRGGGIFSFLPIAEKTESHIMEKYFYYNHSISIGKLCAAHGVMHRLVETKVELHEALAKSQLEFADNVIEVASCIDTNTAFHRILRNYASQASSCASSTLLQLSALDNWFYKIAKLEYSLYNVHLAAPPTTVSVKIGRSNFLRQGFILSLTLDDGSTGFGEIAPLDIHKESLQDVEDQLRFLLHTLKGATITCQLPLLKDSFSAWIWRVIGVPPLSIFPSVRCGLEMAILNAIASRQNCSLLSLLWSQPDEGNVRCANPASMDICALLDSDGTPQEVAEAAFALVEEGFRAVKVKVARKNDPKEDAAVIKEVRRKIGSEVELRVDANRRWTYEKAIEFGSLVKDSGLQYIEEPVQCEDDILKFCKETNLPVALDETVDDIQGNIPEFLARFTHPGIVALVVKPAVVGGFEKSAAIASWAHIKGKLAVVSSAFESSLSLSSYVQFACYLQMISSDISQTVTKVETHVAHGLGTYKWLKEDVTTPLDICRQPHNQYIGASVADADRVSRNFQMNHNVITNTFNEDCIAVYQLDVKVGDFSYSIKVQETVENSNNKVLVFLHGLLGTGEDWIPMMKALSGSAKCIALDLPGHGKSKIQSCDGINAVRRCNLSIDIVATVLSQLLDKIAPGKVTLVGYSMGARIALYMALRYNCKVDGAIVISGSPGIKSATERRIRAAKDDSRACSLTSFGLSSFLDTWYYGDLWKSLREHPSFEKVVASRSRHDDIHGLANALSDLSIGRQPSLWEDLQNCKLPLLYIVGEKDAKFKKIMQEIHAETGYSANHDAVEVPDCGHAVHLENPLALVKLVREFLSRT